MPARSTPFRAAAHLQCLALGSGPAPDCTRPTQRRLFHGTRTLRDDIDDTNHYETLKLQTNASTAEIKKSFYTLSQAHHPDHNRADPHASRRFMRISEAYRVLSHNVSRAKYDRDVLRLHASLPEPAPPRGSYASTGPAGGRPASGLSRRRSTFRGPPPSFYRSGGWGAHGAKRSAAHDESTGSSASSSSSSSSSWSTGAAASARREQQSDGTGYTAHNAGGMGPGQEPLGRGTAAGGVPHFDQSAKAAHTRTHDKLRRRRTRSEGVSAFSGAAGDSSEVGTFFLVLAVLGITVGIPYVAVSVWNSNGSKKKRE